MWAKNPSLHRQLFVSEGSETHGLVSRSNPFRADWSRVRIDPNIRWHEIQDGDPYEVFECRLEATFHGAADCDPDLLDVIHSSGHWKTATEILSALSSLGSAERSGDMSASDSDEADGSPVDASGRKLQSSVRWDEKENKWHVDLIPMQRAEDCHVRLFYRFVDGFPDDPLQEWPFREVVEAVAERLCVSREDTDDVRLAEKNISKLPSSAFLWWVVRLCCPVEQIVQRILRGPFCSTKSNDAILLDRRAFNLHSEPSFTSSNDSSLTLEGSEMHDPKGLNHE